MFYRAGLQNSILPEQIDRMTLRQLTALMNAADPDDGTAALLVEDETLARAAALAAGFAVK